MSPKSVSVTSIARRAATTYPGHLKALFVAALIESTAFAIITLLADSAVGVAGSNQALGLGEGLSLSAGAWILSAFAAAEFGILEQASPETRFQRVRRRLGALLGVTFLVNLLGGALVFAFLWLLPFAAEDGALNFYRLIFGFLLVVGAITVFTNLAVSVLMIEDCSLGAAWDRAADLMPREGKKWLITASLVVLVLPALAGIAIGAFVHSTAGVSNSATEFTAGIVGETLLGPYVAAFVVGTYVALRDRQVADMAAAAATSVSSAGQ